jgi:hypothetical protein
MGRFSPLVSSNFSVVMAMMSANEVLRYNTIIDMYRNSVFTKCIICYTLYSILFFLSHLSEYQKILSTYYAWICIVLLFEL